jgi:hypothetical protein
LIGEGGALRAQRGLGDGQQGQRDDQQERFGFDKGFLLPSQCGQIGKPAIRRTAYRLSA